MALPILYGPYIRPPDDFEKNSGEIIVEKTGYVPTNVLIENMIYAGERLNIARSEYYDFPNGNEVDYDYIDPTRSGGFDPADADLMNRSVSGRLAEQRKIFEKEKLERELAEKMNLSEGNNGTS